MVQTRIAEQMIERLDGTRLGIRRAVDDDGEAGLEDGPRHIGQGSSVTYKVQPSSRHDCRASAAWVMAIISAWAVGS